LGFAGGPVKKEEDRSKFQQMVKEFSKQALLGVSMEVVDHKWNGSGKAALPGKYTMDKALRQMTVLAGACKHTMTVATCLVRRCNQSPLGSVPALRSLGDVNARIVHISGEDEQGEQVDRLLLLLSEQDVDAFVTSMAVLRQYGIQNK